MPSDSGYRLVKLPNGACSVHSVAHGETMHPGLGPILEAEALYVGQLQLTERLREVGAREEIVIWDVGLGAAANTLAVLRALRHAERAARVLSFDITEGPLQFALSQRKQLGFFDGYEAALDQLLDCQRADFQNGRQPVRWELHLGDFPSLLKQSPAGSWPKPHAILFDPWSPAKNPSMWTAPLFSDLFNLLDATRPCGLSTYSRSTMLRVSLLLAGFWVGAGSATGRKEETTMASNRPELIRQPLDGRWLERARRSRSAEPLWELVYRQAPLAPATWERLRRHPQFVS